MTREWKIKHDVRSSYAILKRCSPQAVRGGWNQLGSIIRWTDGYGWEDLSGHQDSARHKTMKACLAAFIAEMDKRKAFNGGKQNAR